MAYMKKKTKRSNIKSASEKPHNTLPAPSLQWSFLLAAAALLLYIALAPSACGDKDACEFSLVLAVNGAPHQTGYPLYAMLGHVFVTFLHALNVSWELAANAWSALGGAVAVFFIHAACARLMPSSSPVPNGQRIAVALLPAFVFGCNPIWTYETTLAEVNSWHVAWVTGIVFTYIVFIRKLVPAENLSAGTFAQRDAAAWGFLCGIGAAHHVTAGLVALPLTISLVWMGLRLKRLHYSTLFLMLIAGLLPLVSYGFIVWRAFNPAAWQWPVLAPEWSSIYRHVTAAGYGGYLGYFQPDSIQQGFLVRYVYLWLFPSFLVLSVSSFFIRTRPESIILRSLAVTAAACILFCFLYGVSDPSAYFLAPMAISLCGATAALHMAAGMRALRGGFRAACAAVLLPLIILLSVEGINTSVYRRNLFNDFYNYTHSVWKSLPFDKGFFIWSDDNYERFIGYQLLYGEKPNIEIVNPVELGYKYPRDRFVARHGFDPHADIAPFSETANTHDTPARKKEYGDSIARNIINRSTMPVAVFDGEQRSLRIFKHGDIDQP